MPWTQLRRSAVLALSAGVMGYFCVRFITLLAEARPYTGWYWLLAVAGGIGIAVALPWALVRGARRPARWPGWLLVGYTGALVGGMQYYLSLRFTPPRSISAAPPPLPLVLEITGLTAVTLTFAVLTLLVLAALAGIVAPGSAGGWLRAQRARRAGANAHSGPGR